MSVRKGKKRLPPKNLKPPERQETLRDESGPFLPEDVPDADGFGDDSESEEPES